MSRRGHLARNPHQRFLLLEDLIVRKLLQAGTQRRGEAGARRRNPAQSGLRVVQVAQRLDLLLLIARIGHNLQLSAMLYEVRLRVLVLWRHRGMVKLWFVVFQTTPSLGGIEIENRIQLRNIRLPWLRRENLWQRGRSLG